MQIRTTIKFVFLALISLLLGGMLVYLTLWPSLSRLITPDIFPILRANFIFILFWNSVPIVLLIFVAGIIITHRIAGPVYNIETKLDKALRGEEIQFIRLRKGDELQELADKINALLQRLQETEQSQKR
jgi:signal transduction histidine kinase